MTRTPTGHSRATILIADDHAVVAEGLTHVLAPYFSVLGQVRKLDDLIPALIRTRPQAVLLDITFGSESSLSRMKQAIVEFGIAAKFIVLTAHESRTLARAAFDAGASAFLVKGASSQDVRIAIEAALDGRHISAPEASAFEDWPIVRGKARQQVIVGGIGLNLRQLQVLCLLHDGVSRDEVARQLGMTVKGVEYHVSVIKRSTGIPRLLDLLRWAGEHIVVIREAILLEC
jgi:DNA-binding NarL/FixJ family response regulator